MELTFNREAKRQELQSPFVLVDVGVQGGHHPRWDLLGEQLIVHGFDPLAEALAVLQEGGPRYLRRVYHEVALGSHTGTEPFFVNPDDLCSSSLFSARPSDVRRWVALRRLDDLIAEGVVPQPDFIKIDVEGAERFVLEGAHEALRNVLGVEVESNFNVSPTYPKGHMPTIHDKLCAVGLRLFDIVADRDDRGRPSTLNLLFCRDPVEEEEHPENYVAAPPKLTEDQLLKLAVIYDLYGFKASWSVK